MAILRRNTSRLGLFNDLVRRGSFSALGTVSSVVVDVETGEDITRVKTFPVWCWPHYARHHARTHCSRIAFTEWPPENQTLTKFRGYDFSWVFKPEGTSMRIFTAFAIAAALALGTPAFVQAQAQGTSPQSEARTPAAQSNKLIQSVRIVDVKDLKPEMRSKVDDVVAHTSEEDMQSLRKSIDATPEAASALNAEGLSSSQVVAINIAGGVLTMFAKTA
jgi:hypothetical protein